MILLNPCDKIIVIIKYNQTTSSYYVLCSFRHANTNNLRSAMNAIDESKTLPKFSFLWLTYVNLNMSTGQII